MNKLAERPDRMDEEEESETKGPNLFVLYAFLALALLGAMAVAAMIVWPFYARR
jgi:hypothetical protein